MPRLLFDMCMCETNIHQSEFCPPPSVKICLGKYSLCVCLFQIVNIVRDPIRDFSMTLFLGYSTFDEQSS